MFFFLFLLSLAVCLQDQVATEQELNNSSSIEMSSDPQETHNKSYVSNEITESSEPIVITNDIKPEMLGYKHWTGTYSPDPFTVTINGKVIAPGESYELLPPEKTVTICYNYSFKSGMRKGNKTVIYLMQEDATSASLTFSWNDDVRVLLSNATLIETDTNKNVT